MSLQRVNPNSLLLFSVLLLSFTTLAQSKISYFLQSELAEVSGRGKAKFEVLVVASEQLDATSFLLNNNLLQASRQHKTLALQAELRRLYRGQSKWLNHLQDENVAIVHRFWITNAVVLRASKEAILLLQKMPEIRIIESTKEHPVVMHQPVDMTPASDKSPNGREQGITAIKADQLWALGYTGKGSKLLTFDTGLWIDHPAFRNHFLGKHVPLNQAWFPYDSYFPGDKANAHGSHVTGTCLGLDPTQNDTIGIAFNAYFMGTDPIVSNLADIRSLVDIMMGYEWALNPDGDTNTVNDIPDVINNSWGHPFDTGFDAGVCNGWIADLYLNMEAQGIMSVQSAGNEGPGTGTVGSPALSNASLVNNFAVGAVNGNNPSFPIASFSSRGPSACGSTGALLIKPEVVAPGVNVRSSIRNNTTLEYTYANYQGTSMASPHVSGLMLLLREAFPQATASEIKMAVYRSAVDLGPAGEDNTYGNGMIDAVAAFDSLALLYTPATPSTNNFDVAIAKTDIDNLAFHCAGASTFKLYFNNSEPVDKSDITLRYGYSGEPFIDTTLSGGILAENDSIELPFGASLLPRWREWHIEVMYSGPKTEDDTINNAYYQTFWQMANETLPYREDFETGHVFESSLFVRNEDGRITWDSIATTSLTGSTHSAFMRYSKYSPRKGQRDALITPNFQLAPSQGLHLSFNMSYQLKFNGFKDSLIVILSPDCGQTWTDTVYAKGPDNLNTTTRPLINPWMPQDDNDWRKETVDLSTYTSWPQMMVKFISVNGQGNDLYLDNVNIWDDNGPVEVPEQVSLGDPYINVYPNPTDNVLHIEVFSSKILSGFITDIRGRVIIKDLPLNTKNHFELQVKTWPAGVYLLHVNIGDEMVVLRWVKS